MSEYTEWCEDLERALAEPFPADVLQTKSMGGASITFVSWTHYVERLNRLVGAGGWSIGDVSFWHAGDKLVMAVPVTILGVTKVNVGDEGEDHDAYGTAATNAFAQALKRTLALFGMGLRQLYIEKGAPPKVAAPDALRDELRDTLNALSVLGLDDPNLGKAKGLTEPGSDGTRVRKALDWAKAKLTELEDAA